LSRRAGPPAQPPRLAQASPIASTPTVAPQRAGAPDAPRVARVQHAPAAVHRAAAARRDTVVAAALIGTGPDNATTDIEPLKTITPIQVAPIGERTIAPESVAVRPLNPITDVQVAPLTPPD